jgi:hypothetical protein
LRLQFERTHISVGAAEGWGQRRFRGIAFAAFARTYGFASHPSDWFLLKLTPFDASIYSRLSN